MTCSSLFLVMLPIFFFALQEKFLRSQNFSSQRKLQFPLLLLTTSHFKNNEYKLKDIYWSLLLFIHISFFFGRFMTLEIYFKETFSVKKMLDCFCNFFMYTYVFFEPIKNNEPLYERKFNWYFEKKNNKVNLTFKKTFSLEILKI